MKRFIYFGLVMFIQCSRGRCWLATNFSNLYKCYKGLCMSGIASCVVFTSYHVPHMSKSYQPLTCSSDITLSLPSYTGSALKRES